MQNFGVDELMCIIGTKEVEIIALRRELDMAQKRIVELSTPADKIAPEKTDFAVVK